MKRTPLRRRTPLRASSLRRADRSGRTPEEARYWQEQKLDAWNRDRGCVGWDLVGDVACFGYLEPHHRWPRGEGGPDDADNIAWLCAAHHEWAHTHRRKATGLDLMRRDPSRGATIKSLTHRHHD